MRKFWKGGGNWMDKEFCAIVCGVDKVIDRFEAMTTSQHALQLSLQILRYRLAVIGLPSKSKVIKS